MFWTAVRQQSLVHCMLTTDISTWSVNHRDQNLLFRLALIRSLPVIMMQFPSRHHDAVCTGRGRDHENKAQGPAFCQKYYVQRCQQSPKHFPLSIRYIWFPSYACASLHYISRRRHLQQAGREVVVKKLAAGRAGLPSNEAKFTPTTWSSVTPHCPHPTLTPLTVILWRCAGTDIFHC